MMSLINKILKDLEERRKNEGLTSSKINENTDKKNPTVSNEKQKIEIKTHKNKLPPIKTQNLRYTSTVVLFLILAIVIAALVFAAIAFHDRWQGRKKNIGTKPFAEHKMVQAAQKIAASTQAYQTQAKLTDEEKTAFKQQTAQHQAIRKQTNNVTAGLIHQAKTRINIESLAKKSANISVKKTITPTEKADLAYQHAIHQLNNGSTSQAIKQFQTILTMMPDYKPARVALAATLIKHNQSEQAEQILNAGLEQNPNYPAYAELQAHLLVQDNQVSQALTILNRAQPASISENPDYFAFMAALYLQQGHYAQAAAYYRQLTNYSAQYGDWWAGLSISLRKLGQTPKAQQAYERAQEAGNLSPELAEYLSK